MRFTHLCLDDESCSSFNHTNTENGISKTMQMIGCYYVQYFNHTYKRTGTLWEGRYKATLIDGEAYALSCYRYIELNPVRADMVSHPAECSWSSDRCNAIGAACVLSGW